MAKFGMLPNSVVTAQVGEGKKRRQMALDKQQRERQEQEKIEQERRAAEQKGSNYRPKFLQSRRERVVIDMGIKEEQPYVELDDDIDDIDDEQAERDAAIAKSKAEAEEAERLRKLKEEQEAADIAEKLRREAELEEERRKAAEAANRKKNDEKARTPSPQPVVEIVLPGQDEASTPTREPTPPPPPKQEHKTKAVSKQVPPKERKEVKQQPPAKPAPPRPKKEEPLILPPVETTHTTIVKIDPIIPPKPQTPPARPKTPVNLPPANSTPIASYHSVYQDSFSDDILDDDGTDSEEEFHLEDVTATDETTKKENAIHAWNLFDHAMKTTVTGGSAEDLFRSIPKIRGAVSRDEIRPEFNRVLNNFWFPGLNVGPYV
jgi:hypothetical protein